MTGSPVGAIELLIETHTQDAIALQKATRLMYEQARIKYVFSEEYALMRPQVIEMQEAASVTARMGRERAIVANAVHHLLTGR